MKDKASSGQGGDVHNFNIANSNNVVIVLNSGTGEAKVTTSGGGGLDGIMEGQTVMDLLGTISQKLTALQTENASINKKLTALQADRAALKRKIGTDAGPGLAELQRENEKLSKRVRTLERMLQLQAFQPLEGGEERDRVGGHEEVDEEDLVGY